MKTKRRITSLEGLRREKKRLAREIEQEKAGILHEVKELRDHLWPFQVARRFRKTAETIAENKFVVIGVQLATALLEAAFKKRKKEDSDEEEDHGIVDFLKQVAKNFLSGFGRTEHQEKES